MDLDIRRTRRGSFEVAAVVRGDASRAFALDTTFTTDQALRTAFAGGLPSALGAPGGSRPRTRPWAQALVYGQTRGVRRP